MSPISPVDTSLAIPRAQRFGGPPPGDAARRAMGQDIPERDNPMFSPEETAEIASDLLIIVPLPASGANAGRVVSAARGVTQAEAALLQRVPARARGVLEYVRATGRRPSGNVGAREFRNGEGRLPSGGRYMEYDVDPSAGMRTGRSSRRIVIDAETGRAWYTPDHYETFIEMP